MKKVKSKKKKNKKLKESGMEFAQDTDSQFSRNILQKTKKSQTPKKQMDDKNSFVRMSDDKDESDIELRLGDVYRDIFDELGEKNEKDKK